MQAERPHAYTGTSSDTHVHTTHIVPAPYVYGHVLYTTHARWHKQHDLSLAVGIIYGV